MYYSTSQDGIMTKALLNKKKMDEEEEHKYLEMEIDHELLIPHFKNGGTNCERRRHNSQPNQY